MDICGHLRNIGNDSSDGSNEGPKRQIIVANFLPLLSTLDQTTGERNFKWDEDSLIYQMRDGFPSNTEVFYVGRLKVDIEESQQEDIAERLETEFSCMPVFLPPNIQNLFYHDFCKQRLWPFLHSILLVSCADNDTLGTTLFQAYVTANRTFVTATVRVMNSDEDCIWVHDYHLMLLPEMLRKKLTSNSLAFFLHSPFPSSEIFRNLPFGVQILRGLLGADLIGFQTFDHVRQFLSCCQRILGLNYQSKHGYISVDNRGHHVTIKVLSVGVHLARLHKILSLPSTNSKVQEIQQKYKGKTLFLGVDDMDIVKGIRLKLEAMELMLQENRRLRGKVVLVQIANPPRTFGKSVTDTRNEVVKITERINETYGAEGYEPVVLIENSVPYEIIAYYASADCCVLHSIKDGLNLVPYEYIACRQANSPSDPSSMLVLSKFMGCSSLIKAFKVNPWDTKTAAQALRRATDTPRFLRELYHKKHYTYVSSHDLDYWVSNLVQGLARASEVNSRKKYLPLGLQGFFCVSADFKRMPREAVVSSYHRSNSRAIFLDYDDTIMTVSSENKQPDSELLSILNNLCKDPQNTVFIISGRERNMLSEWFSSCNTLGIAAEHGYFIRWNKNVAWESFPSFCRNFERKKITEDIMNSYIATTDGSEMEMKETAVVWRYKNPDEEFGLEQFNELEDRLQGILANEPVIVQRGKNIVEVMPQGINKGWAVDKILTQLLSNGKAPELVICIGDDKSDEDMFRSVLNAAKADSSKPPEVYTCTIGQKLSIANYYVNDISEVLELLKAIAN